MSTDPFMNLYRNVLLLVELTRLEEFSTIL
jgi:hypothetical protein